MAKAGNTTQANERRVLRKYLFHDAMVRSGASEREATAAMSSFISAFWHESMEDARRKKKMEAQDNDKA